ncbi:hypothetical protein FJZ26_05290, partial [Candidatus Parvarchaeota archaeon]|nr:hypothetical protein [Candidatus Parvarchaeota archaeon]
MAQDEFCLRCRLNARVFCPHLSAIRIKSALEASLKETVFGPSPPNVFVGHFGYPQVNAGPMIRAFTEGEQENEGTNQSISTKSSPFGPSSKACKSNYETSDNPTGLYGLCFEEIIGKMSSLVRGQSKANVKMPKRMQEGLQESIMSVKSIDMEARFYHKPVLQVSVDAVVQPMGPSAHLRKLIIAGNPSIPRLVDNLIDDKISSVDASIELYEHGFDSHYLTKLLTCGVLGRAGKQKLVPTKWAITAMDDTLSKALVEEIKQLPQVEEFMVFTNEYLFNHFEVLVMPGAWEYEQFEAAVDATDARNSHVSEDWEGFGGRTKYSQAQGGGYYAARLGICEGLARILKKQGGVVLFREILPDYNVPVGVWEVRENARHAMQNPPRRFETKEAAFDDIFSRLRVPRIEYL